MLDFSEANKWEAIENGFESGNPGKVAGSFDCFFEEDIGPPNAADVTSVEITLNGTRFDLTQGTVRSCRRELNIRNGLLTWEVDWASPEGEIFTLKFERMAPLKRLRTTLTEPDSVNPRSSDAGTRAAGCGGLWQCVVQGFGGLRMRDGKLRIRPDLPRGWKKLSYILLWKGRRLAVTVTPGIVEIINRTGGAPVAVEIWGTEYTFEKELVVLNKAT